jgi:hypothetical protein
LKFGLPHCDVPRIAKQRGRVVRLWLIEAKPDACRVRIAGAEWERAAASPGHQPARKSVTLGREKCLDGLRIASRSCQVARPVDDRCLIASLHSPPLISRLMPSLPTEGRAGRFGRLDSQSAHPWLRSQLQARLSSAPRPALSRVCFGLPLGRSARVLSRPASSCHVSPLFPTGHRPALTGCTRSSSRAIGLSPQGRRSR